MYNLDKKFINILNDGFIRCSDDLNLFLKYSNSASEIWEIQTFPYAPSRYFSDLYIDLKKGFITITVEVIHNSLSNEDEYILPDNDKIRILFYNNNFHSFANYESFKLYR